MAISVDEVTKVISIPQADLQLVTGSIYQLDTDAFRLALRGWESSEPGSWRSVTHSHNPPVTVGGVTLARVVEIINGYTITFEDGQYRVILAGSNNNILDVANINQVSIAPTNSAGLTFSKQVEDQAYTDNRVWVDTTRGLPGTQYPRGTPADPVDTFADAVAIQTARNLPPRFKGVGTESVSAPASLVAYDFLGIGPALSAFTVNSGVPTTDLRIEQLAWSGTMDGDVSATDCQFLNVYNFSGSMYRCGINGELEIADNEDVQLVDCYSDVPGTGKPIISMGANSTLQLRNYSGGVEIRNMTAGCVASLDLSPGEVVLASSNTGGDLLIRGVGELTDNSTGTTVTSTGLLNANVVDAEIFQHALEDGETFEQAMLLIRAMAAGDIVQQENGDYVVKSKSGLIDRIVGSPDSNNGRNVTSINVS